MDKTAIYTLEAAAGRVEATEAAAERIRAVRQVLDMQLEQALREAREAHEALANVREITEALRAAPNGRASKSG